jgi:hypothetical protein
MEILPQRLQFRYHRSCENLLKIGLYSNVSGLRKRHTTILYQTKAKSAVDAAHRRAFLTQG